jgi:hypothetical protein
MASAGLVVGVAASLFITAEAQKIGPAIWGGETHATRSGDTASISSSVLAPATCYEAAGTEAGPPPRFRVAHDIVALQLLVRKNPSKNCMDSPTFVRHHVQGLDMKGKRGVFVWVVADGKIVATWHRVWPGK